jgi:Cytochrome c554 and c-prime
MTRVVAALTFVGVFCVSPIASAQPHRSLCADCHYANGGGPAPRHLSEWESSAHARANVGCEACHGGKPDTVEPFLAHQAIVRGRGAASPLSAANLPRTCGRCHPDVYVEFKKSRHAALFGEGIYEGPTCSTCHSTVAGYLLSPKALESQCNACHGANKKTARPEYAANARLLLQGVRDVRELLNTAKPVIKRVKDSTMRTSLQNDYDQATVPLMEAVAAAHAFVFTNSEERLNVARARSEALLQKLAGEKR